MQDPLKGELESDRFMRELRCPKCRRLLLLEYVFAGRLSVKCKCGEVVRISFKHSRNAIIEAAQPSESQRKED